MFSILNFLVVNSSDTNIYFNLKLKDMLNIATINCQFEINCLLITKEQEDLIQQVFVDVISINDLVANKKLSFDFDFGFVNSRNIIINDLKGKIEVKFENHGVNFILFIPFSSQISNRKLDYEYNLRGLKYFNESQNYHWNAKELNDIPKGNRNYPLTSKADKIQISQATLKARNLIKKEVQKLQNQRSLDLPRYNEENKFQCSSIPKDRDRLGFTSYLPGQLIVANQQKFKSSLVNEIKEVKKEIVPRQKREIVENLSFGIKKVNCSQQEAKLEREIAKQEEAPLNPILTTEECNVKFTNPENTNTDKVIFPISNASKLLPFSLRPKLDKSIVGEIDSIIHLKGSKFNKINSVRKIEVDTLMFFQSSVSKTFQDIIKQKIFGLRYILKKATKSMSNQQMLNSPEFKVLIVEDNHFQLSTMITILKKLNVKFDAAQNGMMAVHTFLQKVKEGKYYSIIFMDLVMPIKDGYLATEEIRQIEQEMNFKRTYICGLSSDKNEEIDEKCKKSGMDNNLKKPIGSVELNKIIESRIQNIN